jgi:hypothetical protein
MDVMNAKRGAAGHRAVLSDDVDWESVYPAELHRVYNFFRYR